MPRRPEAMLNNPHAAIRVLGSQAKPFQLNTTTMQFSFKQLLTTAVVIPALVSPIHVSTAADMHGKTVNKKDVVGHYYMEGVREAAAELLLRPDGKFEYAFMYGGQDESARGRWELKDGRLTLTTEKAPPPSFSVDKVEATIDEEYLGSTAAPVLFVAVVKTKKLAASWSDVDVTVELSNGKRMSGKTGDDGKLAFTKKTGRDWKDVVVKRVGIGYSQYGVPQQWFPIDAKTMKTVRFELEPGNLISPAFDEANLRFDSTPGTTLAFLMERENGRPSWRFVRRN